MYWSAAAVADVPPAVVTVTATVPVPEGEVAVIDVAESVVIVAGVAPKVTALAEPRFVPEMVTEVPPAVEPLVGEIELTVGAAVTTLSVKFCFAGVSIPFEAVSMIGNVPVTVGVPDRTPPLNVTPAGSVPDSVMVGVGLPEAVNVKVPAEPFVKVVEAAEVNAAGELPLGPGTAVQEKPLASPALAWNVTSVLQLSATTPLVLAHTSPASHTPLAELPEPVYSNVDSGTPSFATRGPHWKLFGMEMTCPVPMAVFTGP